MRIQKNQVVGVSYIDIEDEDYLRMAESTYFETVDRFLSGTSVSVWKRLFASPN
jgi:hypothetical protein